ncbi:hypothetical protein [Rhodococcus sp. H29-C3]|uniref:hypothetical protein n=1 Tax=Rhodococcus sp. H29-C3 TaxID=3046307 RepID=UPI0024BAA69E|nr:hypothetical protein [Rhodococcus sp. H29-C3]MDJ0359851.1 hypothetical protein [Rhodococcus sp. H29-C3]
MKEIDMLAKLSMFVLGITVVFFAAYFVGSLVGPVGEQVPASHEHVQVNES